MLALFKGTSMRMRSSIALLFLIATITSGNEHLERKKRFMEFDTSSIQSSLQGIRDQARAAFESARDVVQDVTARVGDAMSSIPDNLDERARQAMSSVSDQLQQARQAGETLGSAASDIRSRVSEAMEDLPMGDQPASERETEDIDMIDEHKPDIDKELEIPVVVVEKGVPKRPEDPWFHMAQPDVGDFGGFFTNFHLRRPWWKGSNICREVTTIDENEQQKKDDETGAVEPGFHAFSFRSSSCHETETSYTCQTKISSNTENKKEIVKYQCCHGFARKEESGQCEEVNLKNLLETMKELGATKMVESIHSTGLEQKLLNENLTVFALTNDAWMDLEADNENNEIDRAGKREIPDLPKLITRHLVPGFKSSGDFEDEEVIPTLNEDETGIRMNVYYVPNKVITANCARLVSMNTHASNGMVHMVDGIVQQTNRSIADIISSDPRFSIFKGIMMTSGDGLMESLKDPKGHFTVFALSNSVFHSDSVDPDLLAQLKGDGGCVKSVLMGHILPHVICTSAIPSNARTINMLDEYVSLTRDPSGKLFVNDLQIVARDIMGTNGVIHVIDGVIVPEKAKTMSQVLKENKMHELVNLLDSTGLLKKMDRMHNITLFAPTKYALRALSNETMEEMKTNPTTLEFHISKHKDLENVYNNELLETVASGKMMRINKYSEFPGITYRLTAQCGRVISKGHEVCGGVIHLVDKVLSPPKGNLIKTLEDMGDFDVFLRLLNNSGIAKKLQNELGPFTLLAPTDEAFYKLPESYVSSLLEDKDKAQRLVKLHILPESICCSHISSMSIFNWQEVRTLDGSLISAHRSASQRIRFGQSQVAKCDVMADNGIIHVLNRVLQPVTPVMPVDVFRIFF